MGDWVTIEGVKPWDGQYPLEIFGDEPLTTREWGFIKRLSGYLPTDITVKDPEVICALAVVALYRAGRVSAAEVPVTFERIIDAPFGSTVRLEGDENAEEEGDDGGPLPPASTDANGSNVASAGSVSPPRSESSEPDRKRFGALSSATSVSDPAISAR